MCSSLLGLGGTHVQQCSECRISRICVPHSRSFKRNSIAASYQHHAGLQPANPVTYTTISCSRRRRSEVSVVYQYMLQQPVQVSFLYTTVSFHPVFRLFSTVYDRTTVRTSDVSYVPYEIFENFKFNMTYCTYIFMPDFYARFTVRLWRHLRTVRDHSVKQSVKKGPSVETA